MRRRDSAKLQEISYHFVPGGLDHLDSQEAGLSTLSEPAWGTRLSKVDSSGTVGGCSAKDSEGDNNAVVGEPVRPGARSLPVIARSQDAHDPGPGHT